MILYRWQGAVSNFGDELNTLLWPTLLPGFFSDDPSDLFLGIGSVLDRRHPSALRKLVAGSGYGGYQPKPRLSDNYIIHWVRGPHTARTLGLPVAFGLGDPAMLVPTMLHRTPMPTGGIGFMPHFETMTRGAWSLAAPQAGLTLIDPRQSPLAVLNAITGCRLLLTEALHGAIVADAMRIPWIAVRPFAAIHRAKWRDWAASLGMTLQFHPLIGSTPAERKLHWSGRYRVWLDRRPPVPADRHTIEQAAQALH